MEAYLLGMDKVILCTWCTTDITKPLRHLLKYHQPFGDYYIYCYIIDDHNNYHHDTGTKCGLSLETTWVTHRQVGELGVCV